MSDQKKNSTATGLATMTSSIEFVDNYNQWILEKFQPYVEAKLLEIGTGHGNYRKYFPWVNDYISVDIDEDVILRAKEKYPDDVFIVADISEKSFVQKMASYKIDAILCTNVVEHINDDAAAIRNLLSILCTGGYLLLFVPALPILYNEMDLLAGHYRRYTKRTLKEAVAKHGQICVLEYFNPVGGIGWWVNKFFKHSDLDSENINRQVLFFDKYVVPISKLFNPLTKHFFGQSLLCVIRKT